jgi:hypothetical protein
MSRREFVVAAAALLPIAAPPFLCAEQLLFRKMYTCKVAGGCVLKADLYGASVSVKKPIVF